jgi:hypothetical protein
VVTLSRASAAVLLIALAIERLNAQPLSAEIDLTAGYSGEEIRAAASQIRLFGEAPAGISLCGRRCGAIDGRETPVIGDSQRQ